MRKSSVLLFFGIIIVIDGAAIGTAPEKCPLQNGNLIDVDLFVESDAECRRKCEASEECFYYFFYTAPTKNRQPPQCFLYETCDRLVEKADADCYIGKENVIGVIAFVEKEEDCIISCSKNDMCSFYKVNSDENVRLTNILIFYFNLFSITTRRTRRTPKCVIIFGPAFLNWSRDPSVLWRRTTTLITGMAGDINVSDES